MTAAQEQAALTPAFQKLRVQVEVTTVCNVQCKMCIRVRTLENRPVKHMAWRDFTAVVAQAPPGAYFCLQGTGEPFLHPDFYRMIASCKQRGFYVETYTNGSCFEPTKTLESGLDVLVLSVLGATPATADARSRGADFAGALGRLEELARLKARAGVRKPKLQFNVCCMKENQDELPEVIRLAARLGVALVQLTPVGDNPDLLPERAVMDRRQPELVALGGELGVKVAPYELKPGVTWRGQTCLWPWTGYYVMVDGKIAPCCTRPHLPEAWIAGEAAAVADMAALWADAGWREFRRALATREAATAPAMCRRCVEYDY